MPAVRDVRVRFIAPACRHTVRWAMYTTVPASRGHRAFRLIHCGRGEKCRLAPFVSTSQGTHLIGPPPLRLYQHLAAYNPAFPI